MEIVFSNLQSVNQASTHMDFENYALQGNEFLHQLEKSLGYSNTARTMHLLRSTFSILRDHLTVEESLLFIYHLPMAIKSMYVDGWQIKDYRIIRSLDNFINEIACYEEKAGNKGSSNRDEIIASLRAVITTLRRYAPHDEIDQALETLPKGVQSLLKTNSTHPSLPEDRVS